MGKPGTTPLRPGRVMGSVSSKHKTHKSHKGTNKLIKAMGRREAASASNDNASNSKPNEPMQTKVNELLNKHKLLFQDGIGKSQE